MTQCTYGNDLIDERQYDLQGRLTHQLLKDPVNTVIDERTYSYDKNSNILGIDTNVEDNGYGYDKLDRVTGDTIDSNIPINYAYDLNDNRLIRQLEDLSIDEMYSYAANSNRVTEQDALEPGATPTLSAVPNRDPVYNDVGRLYQLFEEGILKAEYIYNYQGQRTRKVVHNPDLTASITIYHYDHMGYLITETTETGQLIKDYIWQEGMHPVAQIDNNAGTESIIYLYTDHLMTNRLATDNTQAVVWRWEGEAFGNTPAQELAGISVNLRFPGQYFDEETNLHYNKQRYYDPALGRYITSDPIGLNGGPNTYLYALVNPIINIDPSGLRNIGARQPRARNPYQDPLGGLDTLTNDTIDFFCNLNFAKEMKRVNNQIEQKKAETSECETVYYRFTFLIIGDCKRDFSNVEFSSKPITDGVICSVDGYGRPRCGLVRGSFKGTKKGS